MNNCATLIAWARARALRLTLGVIALATSCSLVVDTSTRQCVSQSDCGQLGLEGMTCVNQVCQAVAAITGWGCLGAVQRPASGDDRVTVTIRVVDVLTTQPPESLQVAFCPKLDVDCAHPLPGEYHLAEDGRLAFRVQAGFDGYLELTAPAITTALFFVTLPVWQDTAIQSVLPVVSNEGFYGIAKALGTTLDLEKLGHVYALASDCAGAPAEGVRFEIDHRTAATTSYYMINDVPVASANATDAAGSGGFLNLDSGFCRITGYVSSSGAWIGEAGFIVRPGAVSYPLILPAP